MSENSMPTDTGHEPRWRPVFLWSVRFLGFCLTLGVLDLGVSLLSNIDYDPGHHVYYFAILASSLVMTLIAVMGFIAAGVMRLMDHWRHPKA